MKTTPEFDPSWARDPQPAFTTTTELDGLVRAGMKTEALGLVRRLLKARTITAPTFVEAANAILTLADKVKPWKALVEAAYERVPKRNRGSLRFWMMSIRSSCRDYEGVLRLVPKRFTGEFALLELLGAVEATFETNNKELMRKLAQRLTRVVDHAEHPVTKAWIRLCLAEVCAREGAWDEAIALAEPAQECSICFQNAVSSLVVIHFARALKAVQRGFRTIEMFRKEFDPETELTIPGNEKAMLDKAAKEFRRLQKILERIVPQERQKELRIA